LLVRDATHIGVMFTGASSYLPLVSAADSLIELYNGEYIQALTHAGEAAVYMMLPTILRTAYAPIFTASVLAYTGYKVANNLYTFYTNCGTLETRLKSNLAYADLENNLGLKDMAKECLVNAKQIVEKDFEINHDHNSPVQKIAEEYKLIGKLCELDQSFCDC
jgi:hypothetical protein